MTVRCRLRGLRRAAHVSLQGHCGMRGAAVALAFTAVVGPSIGCGTGREAAPAPVQAVPSAAEPSPGQAIIVGKAPPASGGFPAIIVLEPRTEVELPATTEPAVMDQIGLAFLPALLLVRQGQPVQFRNREDVLHNIRVIETETKVAAFNVATPPFELYTHTFDRPGFYSVSCDIHPAMSADILVTSSPYAVTADHEGSFTLSDVPPGPYGLVMYYGTRRIRRDVEITAPRTELSVTLE